MICTVYASEILTPVESFSLQANSFTLGEKVGMPMSGFPLRWKRLASHEAGFIMTWNTLGFLRTQPTVNYVLLAKWVLFPYITQLHLAYF